jgi:electron transfer flavoprotein beta subunit
MRFAVAVKQVPDASEVSVDENGSLIRTGVPSILDPFCEHALMKVLSLKEEGDEVVVFTMGPPQASDALRRCLCLGADKAYLLSDRAFAGADTWATSRALAAFIGRFLCDAGLYVFGRQASDGETGQVPYETAQLISARQFAYVTDLRRSGHGFEAVQDYGDVIRTASVPAGSVVSFSGTDPCGTLMSLTDRIRGYGIPIETVDRVAIGLGVYSVGLKGSRTKIVGTDSRSVLRKNRKVAMSSPARAAELILEEMEAIR